MGERFELDPADRLLIAGVLKLGAGLAGVSALGGLAAAGTTVAVVGTLGTAGLLAIGPALIVAGAYAKFASPAEQASLLAAGSAANEAVSIVLGTAETVRESAKDWIEEKIYDTLDLKNVAKDLPDELDAEDVLTTKEKTFDDFVEDAADRASDTADKLLDIDSSPAFSETIANPLD